MKNFSDYFSELANLQWFEPEAFKENDDVPGEVCGFVLSLALIYNDIKNIAIFYHVIKESKPPEPIQESKEWGEFSALQNFIDRITIGILHELFNLIKTHEKVLKNKFFISIIKSIPKGPRNYWQAIVDSSFEKYNDNKLVKDLMIVRNKVAFHYDPKVILNGYRYFFENARITDKAYVSRGNKMPESRFYFADAAAQGSIQIIYGSEKVDHFFNSIGENLRKVNIALLHIMNNFINKKSYAFRENRN